VVSPALVQRLCFYAIATNNNFREDVTVNGVINSSDVAFVQAHSGTALP
jgi:hypothetical protein